MSSPQELRRELGVPSAVLLGLGSILGTGVFVCIGLGAGIAGPWVVAAVLVAALVATCNALSSAQLAAAYPRSGGTYEYGYELLSPMKGFIAGWMFLSAKSASAATAALGFAVYAMNLVSGEPASRMTTTIVGCVAVVVLTVLVAGGLKRSNIANTVIVGLTLVALLVFVVAGIAPASRNWSENFTTSDSPGIPAFLEACALMFVAYTGYGRVATLGEEVANPRTTIPKAIVVTLGVSAVLYFAVATIGVGAVGSQSLFEATGGTDAPLEVVSREFGVSGVSTIVTVGAMTAMLGVLLNLLLGLSRVVLAMGRRGDLPKGVTKIAAARSTPWVAVAVVGVIILALTAIGDIALAWSFSAFTVLIYYSLTNLAALRISPEQRLYPRIFSVLGFIACLGLAFWVEREIWIVGLGLIALGALWHLVAQRLSSGRSAP